MPVDALDPVEQANRLANLFYAFSGDVDDFRLSADPAPSPEQSARLKDEAHALDDRAHYFTAEAIGATLAKIQDDLDRIKQLTSDADAQLQTLKDADRAIQLATSVLSLGTAIAAGNPASILAAADALAGSLGV